jgi:hypothetical protein
MFGAARRPQFARSGMPQETFVFSIVNNLIFGVNGRPFSGAAMQNRR